MPLAGLDPAARHRAHMRWAERQHKKGNLQSAMVHFGRALHYGAFGEVTRKDKLAAALRAPIITDENQCAPDETAFSFLREDDLVDPTFKDELKSAMDGLDPESRGRVLGLLSHVVRVLWGTTKPDDIKYTATRVYVSECRTRVTKSRGVMSMLVLFLVSWLRSLKTLPSQRFACEAASITTTIKNAAQLLVQINRKRERLMPPIPISTVGIDAKTHEIFGEASKALGAYTDFSKIIRTCSRELMRITSEPDIVQELLAESMAGKTRFETAEELRDALRTQKGAICASPPTVSITYWDVSQVEDMSDLFDGWVHFNQPLLWNTAKVRSMKATFRGCKAFNQSLDSWDVSNVRDMDYMLFECSAFDQPLSGWKSKVSSVVSMQGMFTRATMFNKPLDWDTRSCTNFSNMFDGAASLASEIRLDMTSAVNAWSVFRIMHGTKEAKLSVLNANAIVSAAPDIQWALAPAAQQHRTCLVCKDRLARYAPPCGHVVLCKECTGKSGKSGESAKRLKVTMRCPLHGCGIEFDITSAFFVNRNMRDDDEKIPTNEDTCGVCFSELPILAHKTCGGSYCRTCWSKILDRSGKCPTCRKLVTVNDISRTFFGLPGKTRARAYKKRGLATSTT